MKVLRIGCISRRDDCSQAIEHFQPARMRARVPGERLGHGLLERQLRQPPRTSASVTVTSVSRGQRGS